MRGNDKYKTLNEASHLGDGVYIDFDGYGYILRANNHEESKCTDQIYIEPDVLIRLINYDKAIKSKYGIK